MTRPKRSLKWVVTTSFTGLMVSVVIIYFFITSYYFIRGANSIVAAGMEKAAIRATEQGQLQPNALFQMGSYTLTLDPKLLPERFAQHFDIQAFIPGQLLKTHIDQPTKPTDDLAFLMAVETSSGTVIVGRYLDGNKTPEIIEQNIQSNFINLIIISCSLLIVFALLFWLFIRRLAGPISALGQWAENLSSDNVKQAIPDFKYPELNHLATLVKGSVSTVQQGLEREQRFVRHASHELRTPIAVVCNNIELLKKQLAQQGDTPNPAAVLRIERAGQNMKHLTETLLWLGHTQTQPLPQLQCDLNQLLNDVIDEHKYLLTDKDINLSIISSEHLLNLPESVARIVISNLVRNAFQHTWAGKIHIEQQAELLTISNTSEKEDAFDHSVANNPQHRNNDLGFGLGLMLLKQICGQLNWQHTCTHDQKIYTASVRFSSNTDTLHSAE